MKKTLSLILSLVMLLSTVSCINFTAQAAKKELEPSGSCGKNATYTFDADTGRLVIDGTGAIEDLRFKNCYQIKSVKINDGITIIEEEAFSHCQAISEVEITKGIKVIQMHAFAGNYSINRFYCESNDAEIYPVPNTIPQNTVIYGHAGSSFEEYAHLYGRTFVDIKSNKTTHSSTTNEDWLNSLPVIEAAEPASYNSIVTDTNSGNNLGYHANVFHTYDKTNEDYVKICKLAKELENGKSDTQSVVEADIEWLRKNVKYEYGYYIGNTIESIYICFNDLIGNCMVYTGMLNYLLYLQDIPSATITTYGHQYSAVYIDGKWWSADATNGILTKYDNGMVYEKIYTGSWYTYQPKTVEEAYANAEFTNWRAIESIGFTTPELDTYVMEAPGVIALASIGWFALDDVNYTDYTKYVLEMPDYVNRIHKKNSFGNYGSYPIKEINSYTGNLKVNGKTSPMYIWAQENGWKVTTSGNRYFASRQSVNTEQPEKVVEETAHKWDSGKITKQPTFKVAGVKTYTCKNCGTKKKISIAKLVSPTVSKLTAGKKKFTVTYKKSATVAGYQVQYATNSKFTKGKKTVTVKGAKNTKKTVSKLKTKKKYFVRVRAYKTINGKKVYSSWSKAKSVKTK